MFPQLYRCIRKAKRSKQYFSQASEDKWLWTKVFSEQPQEDIVGGTYIELGALDGIQYSNTLFFEKSMDWRGILIEAHPANNLRAAQERRRNAAMFTVAICRVTDSTPGFVDFTTHGGAIGASLKDASPEFMKSWHPAKRENNTNHSIACVPLQNLIDATGLFHINLFSLDVEGAELTVLQTVNFNITNIHVILVELDGTNKLKDEKVRELLKSHGFMAHNESIRDACESKSANCPLNEVYVNPNFTLRRRLQRKSYYEFGTGKQCKDR